jgi:hypothetical protein
VWAGCVRMGATKPVCISSIHVFMCSPFAPPFPQAWPGRRLAVGAQAPRAEERGGVPGQRGGAHGQLAARPGPGALPAHAGGGQSAGVQPLLVP